MPPKANKGTPSDDGSSSAGDIPYAKKGKAADSQLKQDLVDAANGDNSEEEDMGEDELEPPDKPPTFISASVSPEPLLMFLSLDRYVVERILNHRFVKGRLSLKVKWQGYPETECTWEPEGNLDGCPDELETYFTEIGGRPTQGKPGAASNQVSKKRKLSTNDSTATSTPPTTKRAGRRTSQARDKAVIDDYPSGSWEDLILNIDTMEMDKDNSIHVFLVWKSGRKTRHPASVCYSKCPQKCLQFYESHLQFNPPQPPPQKAPTSEPATTEAPSAPPPEAADTGKIDEGYADEEEDDDDDTMNVKGVASGT